MRNRFFQILPYVFGAVTGWLLVNPPAFLEPFGPLRFAMAGLLVALLFLFQIAFLLTSTFPENLQVEPLPAPVLDGPMQALVERYRALGFVEAGPPVEVRMRPTATLLPFVHPQLPIYGTIFKTGTLPAKVGFDFISLVDGERGGLTSLNNPSGATLPASPGSLRQVLAGATPEAVFAAHRDAVEMLRRRGVTWKPLGGGSFVTDFRSSISRQRKFLLRAPLSSSLVVLWRMFTKRTGVAGPLWSQPGAERQVRSLLAGRTA